MQFIFSTGSLYNYSIDRCFELASRAGFDGVELMIDHRWDTRQADYVERLTERYQIPVRAVHSPFPKNAAGWAEDYPGAIHKSVELAEALQAPVMVLHLPDRISHTVLQMGSQRLLLPLPGLKGHEAYIRWLLEGMPKLQQSTSVLLCIENMPARIVWGKKVNPSRWNAYNRQTISDITRFPHITLDTTHLGTWGLDPAEVLVRWGRRVKHIHLSNFNGREHRRPEDGHLHLDRFLERLAEAGYNHAVSLELHPDALEAGADDERIVELLTHSLACCRQWSARSTPEPR